jgi:hypothetical protein
MDIVNCRALDELSRGRGLDKFTVKVRRKVRSMRRKGGQHREGLRVMTFRRIMVKSPPKGGYEVS